MKRAAELLKEADQNRIKLVQELGAELASVVDEWISTTGFDVSKINITRSFDASSRERAGMPFNKKTIVETDLDGFQEEP